MKPWDRIQEGLEDLKDALTPRTEMSFSKLSGAPAPPQSYPAQPQGWGQPNTSPTPPRKRYRRRPGVGEIDLHLRLPAGYRPRLEAARKEHRLSLSGIVAELVRRGLDEPPPHPRRSRRIRSGLVEEAVLASLLAIEHTRLLIEAAVPNAAALSADVAGIAGMAAEDRLNVARRGLEDTRP